MCAVEQPLPAGWASAQDPQGRTYFCECGSGLAQLRPAGHWNVSSDACVYFRDCVCVCVFGGWGRLAICMAVEGLRLQGLLSWVLIGLQVVP